MEPRRIAFLLGPHRSSRRALVLTLMRYVCFWRTVPTPTKTAKAVTPRAASRLLVCKWHVFISKIVFLSGRDRGLRSPWRECSSAAAPRLTPRPTSACSGALPCSVDVLRRMESPPCASLTRWRSGSSRPTRSRSKNFSSSTTRYSSASTPSARPRRARVRTDGSSRRERTRRASRPSCRPHPRAWPWRPFRASQIDGGLARTYMATVAGGSWSHSTSKWETFVCVSSYRAPPPRGPRRRPSAGRWGSRGPGPPAAAPRRRRPSAAAAAAALRCRGPGCSRPRTP